MSVNVDVDPTFVPLIAASPRARFLLGQDLGDGGLAGAPPGDRPTALSSRPPRSTPRAVGLACTRSLIEESVGNHDVGECAVGGQTTRCGIEVGLGVGFGEGRVADEHLP